MKKAFIDQMLLGFVLFMVLVFFLATLFDEEKIKNDAINLKTLAFDATNSLASIYIQGIKNESQTSNDAMCSARELTKRFTDKSPFPNNKYTVEWKSSTSSVTPTTVTVKTAAHNSSTFWYKFLNKKSFNLRAVSHTADLTSFLKEKTFKYNGSPDASQYNLVGVYESGKRNDGTICVEDTPQPTLILVNKDVMKKGEILGDGSFGENSKLFFIANGFQFGADSSGNIANNNSITLEDAKVVFSNLCSDNTSDKPIYTIKSNKDTTTRHMQEANLNETGKNVFFEDKELNIDDENHYHKVKKTEYNNYLYFAEDTATLTESEKRNAEAWRNGKISGAKCNRSIIKSKSCFDQWEEIAQSNANITKEDDIGDSYITITENLSKQDINGHYDYDGDFTDMSFDVEFKYIYKQKKDQVAQAVGESYSCQ